MKIIPIPCLSDNYSYLIICKKTNKAAVVDPSEYRPVHQAIENNGVKLTAILTTHHHFDHVGANSSLKKQYPKIDVVGHASNKGRIPEQNVFLDHNQTYTLGKHIFKVLFTPGHTSGSICFLSANHLFTGDTLFGAGCGRKFEGTALQMYQSLSKVIGQLPDDTQLYFGHEYTRQNLKFALTVDQNNEAIKTRLNNLVEPSTPSNIKIEKQTNVFLRCADSKFANMLNLSTQLPDHPENVFAHVRKLKDAY